MRSCTAMSVSGSGSGGAGGVADLEREALEARGTRRERHLGRQDLAVRGAAAGGGQGRQAGSADAARARDAALAAAAGARGGRGRRGRRGGSSAPRGAPGRGGPRRRSGRGPAGGGRGLETPPTGRVRRPSRARCRCRRQRLHGKLGVTASEPLEPKRHHGLGDAGRVGDVPGRAGDVALRPRVHVGSAPASGSPCGSSRTVRAVTVAGSPAASMTLIARSP